MCGSMQARKLPRLREAQVRLHSISKALQVFPVIALGRIKPFDEVEEPPVVEAGGIDKHGRPQVHVGAIATAHRHLQASLTVRLHVRSTPVDKDQPGGACHLLHHRSPHDASVQAVEELLSTLLGESSSRSPRR